MPIISRSKRLDFVCSKWSKAKPSPWCLGYHLLRPPTMALLSYLARLQNTASAGFLSMNQDEQLDLDNLPFAPARSRLEPHRELILRWRRQGRPYRTILKFVKEHCGVHVSYGTLHEFIQRRSRPRKPKPDREPEVAATGNPVPPPRPTPPPHVSQASTDPYAEVRERMRRHKQEPVPSKPKPLFEIPEEDFIKPLQMMQRPPKEK